jgi:hypothetical protein
MRRSPAASCGLFWSVLDAKPPTIDAARYPLLKLKKLVLKVVKMDPAHFKNDLYDILGDLLASMT